MQVKSIEGNEEVVNFLKAVLADVEHDSEEPASDDLDLDGAMPIAKSIDDMLKHEDFELGIEALFLVLHKRLGFTAFKTLIS